MSVISIKGFKEVPRNAGMTKSKMDTLCWTRNAAEALLLPPFQRPLRVNAKVMSIATEMKNNGGVIEGVVTIGLLAGQKYLVDGQHRKEAFLLSGLQEAYVDVRVCEFESMADMAEEFVKLNSQIVRMRPDDILRGLEHSIKGLQLIRKECPFVGYDQIRRSMSSPIVSMAFALRMWAASETEVPTASGKGGAATLAGALTEEDARKMVVFLHVCHAAWGRDPEYYKLWGELNLTLCSWIWKRTVTGKYSQKTTHLTHDLFKKGMMGLSANTNFLDWLVGRNNNERDRSPCYNRMRNIMISRIQSETGSKIIMPNPAWYTTH